MNNFIPDFCEPIVGWRLWTYSEHGDNELHPLVIKNQTDNPCWRPNSLSRAVHNDNRWSFHTGDLKSIPGFECFCGFWALKRKEDISKILDNYTEDSIYGQVYLWGRIIEHEIGWRAEYAYPKSIYFPEPCQLAVGIARSYGIELYYEKEIYEHANRKTIESDSGGTSFLANSIASAFPIPPGYFTGLTGYQTGKGTHPDSGKGTNIIPRDNHQSKARE